MSDASTIPSTSSERSRIQGYDVARALAILAMIVVHFSLVMAADQQHPFWLANVLEIFDGRATAAFVILAGIGITLSTSKAVQSGNLELVDEARRRLFRRGLVLLILGFLNLAIWPGDILRIYGISLMLATRAITASSRGLLLAAAMFEVGFIVVLCGSDFGKNWDFHTMTYHGLWTRDGIIRNLFFDGFRSVFPWSGVLLFGIWLGRLDLRNTALNLRVLVIATATLVLAELISISSVAYLQAHPGALDGETITALFGTKSMPALPLFLMSSLGAAVALIAICVRLTERFPGWGWFPLVATGQMALTWYFTHIIFGLGTIVALDLVTTQPLVVAAGSGLLFFVAAAGVSVAWKARFQFGPLEGLMRMVG